ncbi:hypothetical protein JHK87_050708 [Glycine soja]|nr:hypothetical protein JHK87_050706 [Glycine soja]KAG4925168.1 hypothetical protein JHK87_050708 [Glycine soja]
MKGRKHKYGFNNNKREKTEKKKVVDDETGDKHELYEEDPKCLEWLESKESGSVVYVNFGSITVMSAEQLLEFAWGLANSKKPFLWIIRPDLVIGGSVIFSSEFVNETKDKSLIASWCPQEQVLNHPWWILDSLWMELNH